MSNHFVVVQKKNPCYMLKKVFKNSFEYILYSNLPQWRLESRVHIICFHWCTLIFDARRKFDWPSSELFSSCQITERVLPCFIRVCISNSIKQIVNLHMSLFYSFIKVHYMKEIMKKKCIRLRCTEVQDLNLRVTVMRSSCFPSKETYAW